MMVLSSSTVPVFAMHTEGLLAGMQHWHQPRGLDRRSEVEYGAGWIVQRPGILPDWHRSAVELILQASRRPSTNISVIDTLLPH